MTVVLSQHHSIGGIFTAAVARLAEAGVAEPRMDARLLIGHALGGGPEIVLGFPERMLGPAEVRRIAALVAERVRRRPMAQILGRREFWSLPFIVSEDTLDPRPDSECLIGAVLTRIADHTLPLRILDFGTGTGCLLLSLLHEFPAASGVGVDISPAAVAVAARNAAILGLAPRAMFVSGNWGAGIAGHFDVVVANPPYIPDFELAALEPEISLFEPSTALSGGPDGLAAYRALAPDMARLLARGGMAVIEIGAGQADSLAGIMAEAGLMREAAIGDLAGRERALVFRAA